ncbi:MAG: hypothetical protein JWL73_3118 [Actinomycetia bacterium]|nr:hypothetical protein [Actinomycetes bacterium]
MPTPGTRIEVRAGLGDLAEEWDACVDAGPLPSPFLRSWWLDAVAGPDARFVCVHGPGTLIGGLALQVDRVFATPRFRVLGRELTPDHLDLVALRGAEGPVGAALAEWCARPGRRVFDLEGVAQEARLLQVLPGPVRVDVETDARFEPTTDGIDAYLARRSASTRTNLGQAQRRLAREHVETRPVPPAEIDRALDDLFRLHGLAFGDRSQFLPHFDRFRLAARAGAPSGEFRCYEARSASGAVAMDAWTLVAGRASILQRGRAPMRAVRDVGWVLFVAALDDLIADGATELDVLRGTDAWKPGWAGETRELLRLRAGSGLAADAVQQLIRLRARLARTLERRRRIDVS